jgi:chemotaxis response regulator CheB
VERDDPDVVGLGLREPEQSMRELLDLEPALLDEEQPVVLGRSRLEVGEQEVDEAEHPEERVVDFVRDPADELSERAEAGRLEEGFCFGGSWIRAEKRRSGCGWLHRCVYRKESPAAEAVRDAA